MKSLILHVPLLMAVSSFAQSHQLNLSNPETGKSFVIGERDKVLMAIKMPRHQVRKKPADVYILPQHELADSVFVFTKGKIHSINDSTITMLERNSFFSATRREIRIERIGMVKKLTASKQVVRTLVTVGAGLALSIAIFYSYVAQSGTDEFLYGMFEAAAAGGVLSRFGRTKIPKKHLDKWSIQVQQVIAQPRW